MSRFVYSLIVAFFLGLPAIAEESPNDTSRIPPKREKSLRHIRHITVVVNEIFEGDDLAALYRTANNLKVNTREEVVRRELLFKEGDLFDEFLLEESLRNLRALPFLRQVKVTPTTDGQYVDVLVSVNDVWTFIPQASFNISGGRDTKSIGIAETNVLGFGKRAELFVADDEGRKKIEAVWDDTRLWGTYQRLLAGQFFRSDGYRSLIFYGRPFRSLVDRDAWQVQLDFYDLVGRLFEGGDERYIYRKRQQDVDIRYTVAAGDPEQSLYRVSLGYEYLLEDFKEADEGDFDDANVEPDEVSRDPKLLAPDRRFSGPYLQLDQISPDYISLSYLDRFDRTEDYNLGNELSARTWVAADVLGSEENSLNLAISERRGLRLGEKSFVRGEVSATSRLYDEGLTNSVIFGEAKYYNVLGLQTIGSMSLGIHTIAAAFHMDYSVDLDQDREFLLGADSGLRGYEARAFTGDKRLLLSAEDRFVVIEDIYKLFSVGGAFFVDAGGATDDSVSELFGDRFYSNVGFGLRFGFPRFGGGVLRVDVAFPMREDPEGSKAWEPRLSVSTGNIFTAKLPADSRGPGKTQVTTGLDE